MLIWLIFDDGDDGDDDDDDDDVIYIYKYSDWWLNIWIVFTYIRNFIIPTDFQIFQRGRYTTNQCFMLAPPQTIEKQNPTLTLQNI